MGRKERKRYADNQKVRDLLEKKDDELTAEDIEEIRKSFTGAGGLMANDWSGAQFFTPSPVAKFIVDLLQIPEGSRVLEPSCGKGAFIEHLPKSCDTVGIEINRETARIARLLNPHATIINENALEVEHEEKFDFVIMNPPYSLETSWQFESTKGKKYRKKSEAAFIEYGLKHLKEGGVMAALVGCSVTNIKTFEELRDWILKNNMYLGTIDFPSETFAHVGTQIATSLLLIEKGFKYKTEDNYRVFMKRVEHIGWDSRMRPTQKNDLPLILQQYLESPYNYINRRKPVELNWFTDFIQAEQIKKAVPGQLALNF